MSIFDKIKDGLAKTRRGIAETVGDVFKGLRKVDDALFDELEEALIIADAGAEFYEVRLRPVTGANNGLVLFPAVNSFVIASAIEGGDLAVIMCSQYESAEWKIENTKFAIDKNGYKIESQNENLNKILSDFIDEVAKIIVVQGTSPNVPALKAIKQRLNTVLK